MNGFVSSVYNFYIVDKAWDFHLWPDLVSKKGHSVAIYNTFELLNVFSIFDIVFLKIRRPSWFNKDFQMLPIFTLCLLLIYYCYFYFSMSSTVPKPATGSPLPPEDFQCQFVSQPPHHFQFIMNGQSVWDHTLLTDEYIVHQDKIVQMDVCHTMKDGTFLPAKGEILYHYLKSNPETFDLLKFKENTEFMIQQRGDVFYFECQKGRIEKVHICPSGTTFMSNQCQPVTLCTDKPDFTKLPHTDAYHYLECFQGVPILQTCPHGFFFYQDRCESMHDLTHFCRHYPNASLKLDSKTRLECRHGKPFYKTCTQPGTRFFDQDFCEPDPCLGYPNGAKIPHPRQKISPFYFSPGYSVCQHEKIEDVIDCPQIWDDTLSNGDNLTFLPMVFDGRKCAIPTFCENVFSEDPDVLVPVHEFSKHVKNWQFSQLLDHMAGFQCEGNTRKRKVLDPGFKISEKRFKPEKACENTNPLPIYGNPRQFYNCATESVIHCPQGQFFNGSICVNEPLKDIFKYQDIPFFQFNALNLESWIQPFDYSHDSKPVCDGLESVYNELYNICMHPDCEKYAFVSQIPDFALLLPKEHSSKCKFYENEKRLKKESVEFEYQFWNQRRVHGYTDEKRCVPGQKLETGHFIWDNTIFATCNLNQPFVFCPNSKEILPFHSYYACAPPETDTYILNNTATWTHFADNEIRNIVPLHDNTNIQLNKRSPKTKLSNQILQVPENTRLNINVNKPVQLQVRYRVTHPPNVVFEYDDWQKMHAKTASPEYGFIVKTKNFTKLPLTFPKYEAIPFVDSFHKQLYI